MPHYAKVQDAKVVQVIRADDAFFTNFTDSSPGFWLQTSYGAVGGIHYGLDGQPDGGQALRKNFAGIGYGYDAKLDAFFPPQPFPSWTLNQTTALWDPPVPYPTDGKMYYWDELSKTWKPAA